MNPKLFILETIARFIGKSPSFFKIIQIISVLCIAIGGIPELLQEFNIIVPFKWEDTINKMVMLAGAVSFIISKLPVEDPNSLPKPPSK